MQRLQVSFGVDGSATRQSLEVPDLVTALIVAEINMGPGLAEIRDGERLVARLERHGRTHAPFWTVC